MRFVARAALASTLLVLLLAVFGMLVPVLLGPEPAPDGVVPTTYGPPR